LEDKSKHLKATAEELSEPEPTEEINLKAQPRQKKSKRPKRKVVIIHEDLIKDAWWTAGRGRNILQA
jgi:hypothetical protein